MLEKESSADTYETHSLNWVIEAIVNNNVKEVNRLCYKYADTWTADDRHGLLLNTIEEASLKMVKLVAAHNLDLTRYNNQALRLAVKMKRHKVAAYLTAAINVEAGCAEPACTNSIPEKDLLVIIENQDRELVRLRLERDHAIITTRLWEIVETLRSYSTDAVAVAGVLKTLDDDTTPEDIHDDVYTALVNDITHVVMIAGFNNLDIETTMKCRILLEHSSDMMELARCVHRVAYDLTAFPYALTVTDVLTYGMSSLNNACDECSNES